MHHCSWAHVSRRAPLLLPERARAGEAASRATPRHVHLCLFSAQGKGRPALVVPCALALLHVLGRAPTGRSTRPAGRFGAYPDPREVTRSLTGWGRSAGGGCRNGGSSCIATFRCSSSSALPVLPTSS